MALKLESEFVVAAPVGPTWKALVDLERVARCLPGASIEPSDEQGNFPGSMRVKVGPMTMEYKGVARIEEADEGSRTAVFNVRGKELRGQGSASATIRNTLVEQGSDTRVLVETELTVTGRPAQFGRGIMQDVATSMLADFAHSLSEMLATETAVDGEAQVTSTSDGTAARDSLDLTAAIGGVLRRRLMRWTGLAAAGRLLARMFGAR